MPEIMLLDQETIDKIAAGEVVERPSSVVKELVENAIDAEATAITVEIKEGGIGFIRITDNGCGIEKKQVQLAFLRHSTSKIRSVEDLLDVSSLGFRGEALSSIAAVAQVELITKTRTELTGTRYRIEGSKEKGLDEIGAPDGTTFLVRNLFYNTPARRKFLKSAQTEGNYVADLMERMALSHPDIAFHFIANGQTKLHTSGNAKEKDLIYHIFGRDITRELLSVEAEQNGIAIHGFLGRPSIARGNRSYENLFVNGRYIRSAILTKAIEDGYKGFLMQHQYPFFVLYLTIDAARLDINVHPTKMELRISEADVVYQDLCRMVRDALSGKELIPQVPVKEEGKREQRRDPQPIHADVTEKQIASIREKIAKDSPYEIKYPEKKKEEKAQPENLDVFLSLLPQESKIPAEVIRETSAYKDSSETPLPDVQKTQAQKPELEPQTQEPEQQKTQTQEPQIVYEQQSLMTQEDTGFLTEDARKQHKIIGQLFETYWLVEYDDQLFLIDQHAAHEKVLYERTMARVKANEFTSQIISPPVVLTLNREEEDMLTRYQKEISSFGYSISHFGGKEYTIDGVPAEFESIDVKAMLIELLDDFATLKGRETPDQILEKVASMSCKAAIKGNQKISRPEMEVLIDELLSLENPYQCPHGRPTIIAMSRYEIEKKFKRIVN